jgi:ferredoxin-NADP reductase
MTWTLPGMLLAVAGTLCLVLVVVTSVRAARRRLRYESWHLLHLYAYLGVGLALPHQLWTGGDFLANPLATAYWWTAWAATAAAVVVFRLGLPAYRTLRHRLVVRAVVDEAPGVVSVHLAGRHLDELPARAGQFLLLRFLSGPGRSRAHPYSLSAVPSATGLRVTVKDLGDDSARVRGLRPGTRVLVEGPYGRLTAERRSTGKVLLLGAGIGITPLRALAEELPQLPGDVVVVHRVRSMAETVFLPELEHLERTRGLRAVLVPGPRNGTSWAPVGSGPDGATALRRIVPDVAEREVYVCGPDAWTAAALEAARRAGVPERRLHAERFAW